MSGSPVTHRPWAQEPLVPQIPFVQLPLQHCALLPHMPPSGVHCCLPQMPFVQAPVQHSLEKVQGPPSGVHIEHCGEPQRFWTASMQS